MEEINVSFQKLNLHSNQIDDELRITCKTLKTVQFKKKTHYKPIHHNQLISVVGTIN